MSSLAVVKPKVRGFICVTAHPAGCAANVREQIDYVKKQPPLARGPKKVLIIGASTGYGLSSRIAAAFGSRAATLGAAGWGCVCRLDGPHERMAAPSSRASRYDSRGARETSVGRHARWRVRPSHDAVYRPRQARPIASAVR